MATASLTPGCMIKRIPPGSYGSAEVSHVAPTPLDRIRGAINGMPLRADTYTRLLIDGRVWMTDCEFECCTNLAVVRAMRGDVLIVGLGIGLVIAPAVGNGLVSSVTVLEISQDVAALIGPQFPSVKIIVADAKMWEPPSRSFDCIYFDIWPDVPNSDNREEIKELKARYRKSLRKGGWMKAWCESRTRK